MAMKIQVARIISSVTDQAERQLAVFIVLSHGNTSAHNQKQQYQFFCSHQYKNIYEFMTAI